MQITIPVSTPTPVNIRDDWQSAIITTLDDPNKKEVRALIPGTPALPEIKARAEVVAVPAVIEDLTANPKVYGKNPIVGRPAVEARAAVPATVNLPLLVWSGDAYDAAQAMRGGEGWGQSDLIAAVEAILNRYASA